MTLQGFATDSVQAAEFYRRTAARDIAAGMRANAECEWPTEARRETALGWSLRAVEKLTRLDYRPVELDAVKAHARAVWVRIASDPITDHVCPECGTRYLPRSGGRCPCVLGS